MDFAMGPINILPTKSMQNVVTSIATKLTHLIISSQNKENLKENGNYDESLYKNLVQSAELTNSALKNLAEVTLDNISHYYPDDIAIYNEAENATQNLILSGEKMLLACQILTSTSQYKSNTNQNQSNKHSIDLQDNISKTFQNLVVVLLCVDNAEVRSLINLANDTLEELNLLNSSADMESLIENLSTFALCVHDLHQNVWKRSCELISESNQNQLKQTLNSLKHSIPMLTTACSMSVKYNNEDVLASKEYAVNQVTTTIHDIVSILKQRYETPQEKVGTILQCTNYIDDMLSPDARPNLEIQQLESQVQILVQKVMEFSSYVTESFPKMKSKSKQMVKDCQKLVELVTIVSKMNSFESPKLSLSLLSDDKTQLTSICRSLRGKLKSLSNTLNSILMALVGYVFSITNEPFVQVLAVQEKLNNKSSDHLQVKLKNTISALKIHCNNILKVSEFVLSSCAETVNFDELQSSITQFSNITSKVLENLSMETQHKSFDDDLKQQWEDCLKNLLSSVINVMNVEELTLSLEKGIIGDFEKCHEDIVNLDDISLSNNLINATGKCKLLGSIANHCVSVSYDPLYRNGLLAYIEQHNEAIAHTIASGNQLVEDTAQLPAQEHFLAMSMLLKTSTSNLRIAILSKENHPHVISHDRKGLRNFSDQGLLCGMIKNMHVLNKKLASLGFEPQVSALTFNNEKEQEPNHNGQNNSYFNESEINVDDLFGLSGPPIDLESASLKSNKSKTNFEQISLNGKTENDLNPLVEQLLEVIKQGDVNEINLSLNKIKEITFALNQIIHDSCLVFKTSKLYIENKSGLFSFTKAKTGLPVLEHVQKEQENLNESCSLIDEAIKNSDFDSLNSICLSWSNVYDNLFNCAVRCLELYSITVKKFIFAPDSSSSVLSISDASQASLDKNTLLDKSTDGLLVLGRLTETLLILSSDVITLYKKEKKKSSENKVVIVNHMNDLLKNIQRVSADITTSRKKLKVSGNLSPVDSTWLQLYSLTCSSKLFMLTSYVSSLTQTVLGIRDIKLPIRAFMNQDVNIELMFKQYKSSIKSVAQTAIDKVKRINEKNSLGLKEQTKLNKIRDRIEVTCQSLKRIVDFLTPLKSNKEILKLHGFVICHLMFLHQRFLLEVCRIFLVINALNLMDKASEYSLHESSDNEKSVSIDNNSGSNSTIGGKETKEFSQRLETLKQERKERESDLFQLLSVADNFVEIPIKNSETKDSTLTDESFC